MPDGELMDATTSKTINRGRRKRKSKDKDDVDADIDQGASLNKSQATKKRRLLQYCNSVHVTD